jgi:hypothetical protein
VTLVTYTPGATDPWLVAWWLAAREDLPDFLVPSAHRLAGFLAAFPPPVRLWLGIEGEQVQVAAWGRPWLSGTLLGVWIASGARRSASVLLAAADAVRAVLAEVPVAWVLAVDGRHRALYSKVGTTWLGTVPEAWDGHAVTMGWLTEAQFTSTLRRRWQIQDQIPPVRIPA